MVEYAGNCSRQSFFDKVSEIFNEKQRHNLIIITHLLPDRPAFIELIARFFEIKLILSIPYSENSAIVRQLRETYDVRSTELEQLLDCDWLMEQVKDVAGNEPYYVLEIGGYFAALANRSDAIHLLPRGIVECTESGLKKYSLLEQLGLPVIAMPTSKIKAIEAALVGPACLHSIQSILRNAGEIHIPKSIHINGYGKVGRGLAYAARNFALDVTVFDVDPEKRLSALSEGFRCPSRINALKSADIIAGCAGERSWFCEDIENMKENCFLVSATSKDVEFNFDEISEKYKSIYYNKDIDFVSILGKKLFFLFRGRPVNFRDGADLGFILTLVQAEMFCNLMHLPMVEHTPGLHSPSSEMEATLTQIWFDHFIDSQTGWYKSNC